MNAETQVLSNPAGPSSEAVFLAAMVESSDDSIIGTDLDGHIVFWNRGAQRMFGYTPEEALGRRVTLVFPPEAKKAYIPQLERMKRGEWLDRYEAVRVAKDGSLIDVSVILSPVRLHSGEIIGASAIYRDMTQQKRHEAQVLHAKEAAEAANRAKSEFLANMSHEIRTPMNGVMGMLELVLGTELGDEQREFLTIAKMSADSLLTVINDILDFSKIEAGRLELDPIPFNLRDHMEETTKALALRAHEKGLELVTNVHRDVPEYVVGDVTRLRQIVVNLIGNSIKFTSSGEVELEVRVRDGGAGKLGLHFAVRDTGIGIPAEKQKMIFEAFSQVDGSTTRKYGGTGLGLAISARLVNAMQGQIWVESVEGRGSCFHFTVDLDVPDEIPATQPVDEIELSGRHVLLVDDNLTNRRVLADMLSVWKMHPLSAASAPEALAHLRRAAAKGEPYELVLTDVHMPDMDGFDLVQKIRDSPNLTSPVVLMLTSGEHTGDLQRSKSLGVSAYLTKPVRRAELRAAIVRAIAANHGRSVPQERPYRTHEVKPVSPSVHVLLVEDNVVNQRVARALLEKGGHSVVVADNGRIALRQLEEQSFDLILMDVQMPELDGFETTAIIRGNEQHTGEHMTIVAMTAHAMSGDRDRCVAAGMDDYIAKPIDPAALLAMVAKHTASPAVSVR